MLISDDEHDHFFLQRSQRLLSECVACFHEGHSIHDSRVDTPILVPLTCGHSVCVFCISHVQQCPHPFTQCSGKLPFNSQFTIQAKYRCSGCDAMHTSVPSSREWTCSQCLDTKCFYCDETSCMCHVEEHEGMFSRHIRVNEEYVRKKKLSIQQKALHLQKIKEDYFHPQCPSCTLSLSKISACNDLHHCGEAHVCNYCLGFSFPWEKGLPQEHFDTCKRWDHDTEGFQCTGECNSECRLHGRDLLDKERISTICNVFL